MSVVKRENFIVKKRTVICSNHFMTTDVYRLGNKIRLHDNAVPDSSLVDYHGKGIQV